MIPSFEYFGYARDELSKKICKVLELLFGATVSTIFHKVLKLTILGFSSFILNISIGHAIDLSVLVSVGLFQRFHQPLLLLVCPWFHE